MHNTFHLIVASVGETRFDGAALSATFPGSEGEFTILPHHEPFITTLKPGTIRVKVSQDDMREFGIEDGVLECSGNRVVALL